MADADRNREAQIEAYGEPLGEVFRRLMGAFGLSQAGLARVLGISPPMLSQLISAQRVKIGNPAVLHRMQSLEELAGAATEGSMSEDQLAEALAEIQGSTGQWTRTEVGTGQVSDQAVVEGIRSLLRAVASGQELNAAASGLDAEHPALAEVLRVYGMGSRGPALEHFARHRDLF